MNLKEILNDRKLLVKYLIMILAGGNVILNRFGISPLGDTDLNTLADALSVIIAGAFALNVRRHEIKSIKENGKDEA